MKQGKTEVNIYTEIINYAREKLSVNEGVKLADLQKFLKKRGYENVDQEGSHEHRSLTSCLSQYFHRYGKKEHESQCRHYLTAEAFFGSLSHDSFSHSLKTAKESRSLSCMAIVISSVLALVSIILSVIQMTADRKQPVQEPHEIEIRKDQFDQINRIQNQIIERLDSIKIEKETMPHKM